MLMPATLAPRAFAPAGASARPDDVDAGFVQMLDAYRAGGGIARADDVVSRLHRRGLDGVGTLARWIANGQVLHFQWNEEYWLPLFQFGEPAFMPRAALQRVLAQLAPALDAWDMARWFAHPNPWLGGAAPASLLATAPLQVEQAARADRFAVAG
jgi:hypothetical protein